MLGLTKPNDRSLIASPTPENPTIKPCLRRALGQWVGYLLLLLGVVAVGNLFVLYFVRHEHYLYYWDGAVYWSICEQMRAHWLSDPLGLIGDLFFTIRYSDYNFVPGFLPSLGMLVFGNSRAAYLLLVTDLYAVPVVFLILCLFKTVTATTNSRRLAQSVMVVSLIMLSPIFWAPIVMGYSDVGGLILVCVILILYFAKSPGSLRPGTLATIGVLLALLPMFRRWYGYWSIAFCVVAFFDLTVDALLSRPRRFSGWTDLVTRLSAIYLPMGLTIVLVSWPLPYRILHEDLSFEYTAYRPLGGWFISIEASFVNIWGMYGPFICIPLIVGLIVSMILKHRRRLWLFMTWLIVLAASLLAKVNVLGAGYQHLYIIYVPIILLLCVLLSDLLTSSIGWVRVAGKTLAAVMLYLSLLNFFVVFSPSDEHAFGPWRRDCSTLRVRPRTRDDIPQLQQLVETLGKVAAAPDDQIYVLASSGVLNADELHWSYLSLQEDLPAAQKILSVSNVDQRDRFPRGLLSADYLLVGWPIQLHVGIENQRVIAVPAQRVLDGQGFGSAFKRLPYDFGLIEGVHAFIYQRTRPLTPADVRDLSDRLKSFYPGHPEIYDPNYAGP